MSSLIFSLIVVILSIMCIIFLSIGLSTKNKYRKKKMFCTKKTQAEITDIEKVTTSSIDSSETLRYMFFPHLKYTANGKEIEVKHYFGNAQPKYEIGQIIDIFYNPEKPEDYYIDGEKGSYILGKIFTGCGILFLLLEIITVIIYFIVNKGG